MPGRRRFLRAGGAFAAGLLVPSGLIRSASANIVEIHMRGLPDGSDVWFDPIGLLIRPGQTLRWINSDTANSHTATTYHPTNNDHALRIPEAASPWNSDYLLPNESFEVTLTVEGVYDYYCIPHEMAGMVGRIIVGGLSGHGTHDFDGRDVKTHQPIPEAALKAFPSVDEILERKVVRRA